MNLGPSFLKRNQKEMKVLIISHKPPYPIIDGGCHAMDRMLRDFLISFPDSEIKYMSIATEKHPGKEKSAPPELVNQVEFTESKISTKINPFLAFIHLFSRKSYHISRFKSSSFKEAIYSVFRKHTFDIVLFESIFSAGYIDEIKTMTNAKLIYRAHNIEHKIWEDLSEGESNPIKKWYLKDLSKTLKTFEIRFLQKVDLIYSISTVDQQFFQEFTQTECTYIPVSMRAQNKEVPIGNSLCFLGAFNWKPNKEGIMWFANHIFDELQELFPDLRLEIAGSFSEEIKALSNRKNVKLHGFVESSMDFIQNNGIFIAPLLSGSGVKMKVLEAMSLGVPCVLSSKASEGLDLPPIIPICRNKKEFIEKLSLLLNDIELKNKIGKAGKEFIRRDFSSELVSQKILRSIQLERN